MPLDCHQKGMFYPAAHYLQCEACILRALEGYSAIPHILYYGHLQHFVYLAMELLAKTQALELAATSGVCVKHPLAPDPSKH
jgi:hypothetical protein